jgi:hypothetical protein
MSNIFTLFAAPLKIPPADIGIPTTAANDATLQAVIAAVFLVIGAVSVLFIIIGGYRYIVSNGNASDVTQAKNTILYAVVGLVVTIISFAVVQLVIGLFA